MGNKKLTRRGVLGGLAALIGGAGKADAVVTPDQYSAGLQADGSYIAPTPEEFMGHLLLVNEETRTVCSATLCPNGQVVTAAHALNGIRGNPKNRTFALYNMNGNRVLEAKPAAAGVDLDEFEDIHGQSVQDWLVLNVTEYKNNAWCSFGTRGGITPKPFSETQKDMLSLMKCFPSGIPSVVATHLTDHIEYGHSNEIGAIDIITTERDLFGPGASGACIGRNDEIHGIVNTATVEENPDTVAIRRRQIPTRSVLRNLNYSGNSREINAQITLAGDGTSISHPMLGMDLSGYPELEASREAFITELENAGQDYRVWMSEQQQERLRNLNHSASR